MADPSPKLLVIKNSNKNPSWNGEMQTVVSVYLRERVYSEIMVANRVIYLYLFQFKKNVEEPRWIIVDSIGPQCFNEIEIIKES